MERGIIIMDKDNVDNKDVTKGDEVDITKNDSTPHEAKGGDTQKQVKSESQIKSEILKSLGLSDEKEIEKMKKIYDASLSESERTNKEIEELKAKEQELLAKETYSQNLITALKLKNNIEAEEIEIAIKMASGLVSDTTDFEEAIKLVMEKTQGSTNLKGRTSEQQSSRGEATNPFKTGDELAQYEMFRKDPVRARKYAKEIGIVI